MTLCPERKLCSKQGSSMMTIDNPSEHCDLSGSSKISTSKHDTSQNSVNVPHLQLLKQSIFAPTRAKADNNDRHSKASTESEPGTSAPHSSSPAPWIIRTCRGLWEQLQNSTGDSKQKKDPVEYSQLPGSTLISSVIQLFGKSDRLLVTGLWQILLEESAIGPVTAEKQLGEEHRDFLDRDDVFYRCTCPPESFESDLYDSSTIMEDVGGADSCGLKSSSAPDEKIKIGSSPTPCRPTGFKMDSLDLDDTPQSEDRFQFLLDRLYGLASDAMFRRILLKPPSVRKPKELELVFNELHLVPALSGLSRNVRHELSRCLLYEIHPFAGSTVFSQGDPGTSWYIIHRGSVWVYVKGQGPVCRLSEGDDFGKLALVTGAPRAASIVLAEDNCHFLKVEKDDFDRILRDVEANIVRLREQDSDVLILERLLDSEGNVLGETSPQHKGETQEKKLSCRFINHSIKAGTTEKIVQHILDVRLGGMEQQLANLLDCDKTPICLCPQPITYVDQTVEDFILTYCLFTTDRALCELLMNYAQSDASPNSGENSTSVNGLCMNRTLVFLYCWCQCLGLSLFTKIDHILDFLRQFQAYIDNSFPSSIQSKVISRLLIECESLLSQEDSSQHPVATKDVKTNGTCAGTAMVMKTNSLSGLAISRPLPIRRSTGTRMRFTRLRQPDSSSSTSDWSPRDATTGPFCRQQTSTECALGLSNVDIYPPVLAHCSFSPNRLPFTDKHHSIRFPVYLDSGRRQLWLNMKLNSTVKDIKLELCQQISEAIDTNQLKLVEVSSKGERTVFDDGDRGVVLGLSPNSCLFAVPLEKVQCLAPLPVQLNVAMNFLEHHDLERHRSNQELHHKEIKSISPMLRRMASTGASFRAIDELSIDEIATILTMASVRVAACIGPRELIDYTLGSRKSESATAHVRLLVSHFSLIHTWTITQIVTSTAIGRRTQMIKKFIKIADRLIDAPFYDQHTCFAIVLGLHSSPVARLTHTWERVPMRWRRVFSNRLVPLIEPARNHRAARTWMASTQPPHLPFLALILKDLRFAEDANQTYYSEQTGSVKLINFDKMRLISQSLRVWNRALAGYDYFHPQSGRLRRPILFDLQPDSGLLQKFQELSFDHVHLFFENLECIDDIRVLTQLSLRLEPKRT